MKIPKHGVLTGCFFQYYYLICVYLQFRALLFFRIFSPSLLAFLNHLTNVIHNRYDVNINSFHMIKHNNAWIIVKETHRIQYPVLRSITLFWKDLYNTRGHRYYTLAVLCVRVKKNYKNNLTLINSLKRRGK